MTGLQPADHEPSSRLRDVLELFDELAELARAGEGLVRRLEGAVGLRTGELQALAAVSDGAAHPRAVARRTGQVDEAGGATVDALVERGLLQRHSHPASPTSATARALVHVTDAGRMVLQQAEGLQIRALDSLVREMGGREADSLRSTVQALGSALSAGDLHPDTAPRQSLSGVPALRADPPMGAGRSGSTGSGWRVHPGPGP